MLGLWRGVADLSGQSLKVGCFLLGFETNGLAFGSKMYYLCDIANGRMA